MYNLNNQYFENDIKAPVREFKTRIHIGDWSAGSHSFTVLYTYNELMSLCINQSFVGNEKMTLGTFSGNTINATIKAGNYSVWSLVPLNKYIKVECGLKLNSHSGEIVYIPVGVYKITKCESDDDFKTIKLTGESVQMTWDDDFVVDSTMTNGYTLINRVCQLKGLAVNYGSGIQTALTNYIPSADDKLIMATYKTRDVIAYIAGLVGCCAYLDTTNTLQIKRFNVSGYDYTVIRDVIWQNGLTDNDKTDVTVRSITSNDNESTDDGATYTAGNGKGIAFENPLISHGQVDNILNTYNGLTYRPCSVQWRGDPRIEAGDVVRIETGNNVYIKALVCRQSIDLTGGMDAIIDCVELDADIAWSTVDRDTRKAIALTKTTLEEELSEATEELNAKIGGIVEFQYNSDNEMTGIIIKEDKAGTGKIIKINMAGIGFSSNGGQTYTTVLQGDGLATQKLTTLKVNTASLDLTGIGQGIAIQGNQITNIGTQATGISLYDWLNAHNLTYIGQDGLYSGVITTRQLNIGWSGCNYATEKTNRWVMGSNISRTTNESDQTIELRAVNGGSSGRLNASTNGTSGYFYSSKGSTVTIQFWGRVYKYDESIDAYVAIFLNKRDGTRIGDVIVSYADYIAGGGNSVLRKTSFVINDDSEYYVVCQFANCATDSLIDHIIVTQSVSGSMIINGKIESANGQTYFNLDNAEIASNNESKSLKMNNGGLHYSDTNYGTFVGGVDAQNNSGSGASNTLAVYGKPFCAIGYGANAGDALANGISFDSTGAYYKGNAIPTKFITPSSNMRLERGYATGVGSGGTTVSFATPFGVMPTISLTPYSIYQGSTGSDHRFSATVSQWIQNSGGQYTGFTVRTWDMHPTDKWGCDVMWIAIG